MPRERQDAHALRVRNTSPFPLIALIRSFTNVWYKEWKIGASREKMPSKTGLSGGRRISPVAKTGAYEMVLQRPFHGKDQAGPVPLFGEEGMIYTTGR